MTDEAVFDNVFGGPHSGAWPAGVRGARRGAFVHFLCGGWVVTEFAVMPEGTKLLPGDRVTLVITVPGDGSMRVQSRDEDIRVVERPVSGVVLPAVPGCYESERFPISDGHTPYRLDEAGSWRCGSVLIGPGRMREILPLTRLVPETVPAKLVDRLDLKLVGALMDDISERDYATYQEDGAVLIAAIDSGELDK